MEKNPNWIDGRWALKIESEYNKDYCNKYYQKYKERIDEQNKRWKENNIKKNKELQKEWYLKNKDIILKKLKEDYYFNPEFKLKRKIYLKKPKSKLLEKARDHRRITKRKHKIGSITAEQIKQIFERDIICVYKSPICLVDKKLSLEHIIPISHKELGNSFFYNFVVACQNCNNSKKAKNVYMWCKEQNIEVPLIVEENLKKLFKELNSQKRLV